MMDKIMPNFFGTKDNVKSLPTFTIQIPSSTDSAMMVGMIAGGKEDQSQRLTRMTNKVKEVQQRYPESTIVTTDQVKINQYWTQLFTAIKQGNKVLAFKLFDEIPQYDSILRPLLLVHPSHYLKNIIESTIDSIKPDADIIDSDVIFTPLTFEILIKDIATSLSCPTQICLSFGLPSHHAFNARASGFCILNKTAVLIRHAELTQTTPLRYMVVGTDVNRDNGLCDILMNTAAHLNLCHIDVFDSRVYPQEDQNDINRQLQFTGKDVGHKIVSWHKNNLDYFAVDLSLIPRKDTSYHPAITFTLKKIKENITQAKMNGQKFALYLPTGWDSHENETAPCGNNVNGRMMRHATAHKCRFDDADMEHFYDTLFTLYKENMECFKGIYWGLEGGYDTHMYENQIELFLKKVNEHLHQPDVEQKACYCQ